MYATKKKTIQSVLVCCLNLIYLAVQSQKCCLEVNICFSSNTPPIRGIVLIYNIMLMKYNSCFPQMAE